MSWYHVVALRQRRGRGGDGVGWGGEGMARGEGGSLEDGH